LSEYKKKEGEWYGITCISWIFYDSADVMC
jgi:hypothetical protein